MFVVWRRYRANHMEVYKAENVQNFRIALLFMVHTQISTEFWMFPISPTGTRRDPQKSHGQRGFEIPISFQALASMPLINSSLVTSSSWWICVNTCGTKTASFTQDHKKELHSKSGDLRGQEHKISRSSPPRPIRCSGIALSRCFALREGSAKASCFAGRKKGAESSRR